MILLVSLTLANDWIAIPSGPFTMGCDAATDARCGKDQGPAHSVTVDGYSIQRTEVTQAEWELCVEAGVCAAPWSTYDPVGRADWPISGISRPEAEDYCDWLGGALPTEEQWEKAARGTDGRLLPWGGDAVDCDHARVLGCGPMLGPVGAFPRGASPYGVLDLIGSVWEFVSTDYVSGFAADSVSYTGFLLVMRGPNGFDPGRLVLTDREAAPKAVRSVGVGVRCAKKAP